MEGLVELIRQALKNHPAVKSFNVVPGEPEIFLETQDGTEFKISVDEL